MNSSNRISSGVSISSPPSSRAFTCASAMNANSVITPARRYCRCADRPYGTHWLGCLHIRQVGGSQVPLAVVEREAFFKAQLVVVAARSTEWDGGGESEASPRQAAPLYNERQAVQESVGPRHPRHCDLRLWCSRLLCSRCPFSSDVATFASI